jgi:hypothetical protein
MYRLNFKSLSSLNKPSGVPKLVIPKAEPKTKSITMTLCSYCDSKDHNINGCPIDCDLVSLLSSDVEPDFNNMSIKILKKIATQIGVKTSLGKIHLALIMKKNWLQKKREREEELKKLQREIAALKINMMIEECPVCMEKIEGSSSSTPCGHKFCTSCFVKSVLRKNSCPMCRAKIVDDNEYIDNGVNRIRVERLDTSFELEMEESVMDIDIANYLVQLGHPFDDEQIVNVNNLTFSRNVFDNEEN